MRNIKALALPVILMLGLLMSGIAYAHWEKIITISGSVASGTLDLVIISATDTDDGLDNEAVFPPDPTKGKDVADTTIMIDPQDPERAIVTIENAYPSYEVYLHFTVRNVGTIPAKLQAIIVTAPDCITVEGWDSLGEQIDPYSWGGTPDKYQKNNSGRVHVEQCAEQENTYTFTIEFVYVNWNEYVP